MLGKGALSAKTSPSSTWKFNAEDINVQDLLAALSIVEQGALSVIEEVDKLFPEK